MPGKIPVLKLKLLRWFFPLLSVLAAVLSQFNETGKQFLLERYDVRWFVEQNKNDRKQLVGVSNSGKEKLQGIQIRVGLPALCPRPIADLECGQFEQGNLKSFLKTLEPIWQEKLVKRLGSSDEIAKMKTAITKHTLHDLDQFFKDLLTDRLQKLKFYVQRLGKKTSASETPPPSAADVQAEIRSMQREVQTEVCSKWKESPTGMEVEFKAAEPMLTAPFPPLNFSMGIQEMNFTTGLESGDTRFLHIIYGPELIEPVTKLRLTTGKRLNQVKTKTDLTKAALLMFPKYDPWLTLLGILLLSAIAWLSNWARQPIAAYVSANFALRTKDDGELAKALEQRRTFIITRFQEMCWSLSKKSGAVSDTDLLLHARLWLEGRYSGKRQAFADNNALDTALSKFLSALVSKVPNA